MRRNGICRAWDERDNAGRTYSWTGNAGPVTPACQGKNKKGTRSPRAPLSFIHFCVKPVLPPRCCSIEYVLLEVTNGLTQAPRNRF